MRIWQNRSGNTALLLTRDEKTEFFRWLDPENKIRFQILNLFLLVCIGLSYTVHPEVPHLHGGAATACLVSLGVLLAGARLKKRWVIRWGKYMTLAASVAWTLIGISQTMHRGGFGLPHYFIGVMVLSIVVYMDMPAAICVQCLVWCSYLLLLLSGPDALPGYVYVHSFVFSGLAVFLSRSLVQEKMYHFKTRRLVKSLHEKNHTLTRLSMMDELTDLPNRRYFERIFKDLWQDETLREETVVLIIGDIDFFKVFNDTHGHVAGDECLAQVARILEKNVRKDAPCHAYRRGGICHSPGKRHLRGGADRCPAPAGQPEGELPGNHEFRHRRDAAGGGGCPGPL